MSKNFNDMDAHGQNGLVSDRIFWGISFLRNPHAAMLSIFMFRQLLNRILIRNSMVF